MSGYLTPEELHPTPVPGIDDVRPALRGAICATYEVDRMLFDDHTRERSIMFHIGRRLAGLVDSWPGRWAVDLDYNRSHLEPHTPHDPKRLRDESGKDRNRLPDLIIHHRGLGDREDNLLVVEAKLGESGWREDYQKLAQLVEQHHYQHAVFVQLRTDAVPQWHWIAEARQLHPCGPTQTCQAETV